MGNENHSGHEAPLSQKVSGFANTLRTDPHGHYTVAELLERIRSGKYRDKITKARNRLKNDGNGGYADFKKYLLPGFTLSADITTRKANIPEKEKLISYTGLIQVDIDNLNPQQMLELRERMTTDSHFAFVFTSPGGNGLKAGCYVLEPFERHQDSFFAVRDYVKKEYDVEIDESTKDPFRLFFVSDDKDIFINPDPLPIEVPPPKPPPKQKVKPKVINFPDSSDKQEKARQHVIKVCCDLLDNSFKGNRHHTRLKVGELLGGYIAGHNLSETELLNYIESAVLRNTELPLEKAMKTVISSIQHGKQSPITSADREREVEDWLRQQGKLKKKMNGIKPAVDKSDEEPPPEYEPVNNTDMGNAIRFRNDHIEKVRYCYTTNLWYVWNDIIWEPDRNGTVERLAKDTVRKMYIEAGHIPDDKERLNAIKFAISSESLAKRRAMLETAQSEMPIDQDNLDINRKLITCKNATIDLETGKPKSPDKDDFITKQMSVKYDPEADCPNWKAFMRLIFCDDEELIRYIQKVLGYTMTGDTDDQSFFILYGSGQNGKSTFVETIAKMFGDYAHRTATDTFFVKRREQGQATPDIAKLRGKRFVYANESDSKRTLAESLIKDLTGGDKISARQLHREPEEFYPECKLFLSTNHEPTIRGTDHAIWRRIRKIPFDYKFPPELRKKRSEVDSMFKKEYPGILNWMLEGLLLYQKEDLTPPDIVCNTTEEYRQASDVLGEFFEQYIETTGNPEDSIRARDLYERYVSWTEQAGEKKESQRMFGLIIKERGYEKMRTKTGNIYTKIRLKSSVYEENAGV